MDFAATPILKTDRLTLRGWRDSDIEPFIAMSQDPEVMRYFPSTLGADEARAYIGQLQGRFRDWGFGFWVVEAEGAAFNGFVGLSRPAFDAHFTPAIEIGWRLARSAWGKGYASEAARECLRFGFDAVGADEIVSFASKINIASTKVMARIGMSYNPQEDFDHPALTDYPELCRCALYRLTAEQWRSQGETS